MGGRGGAVNRGFVRFGFVYLSSGRTHTHTNTVALWWAVTPSLGRDLVRQWVTSICSYSSRPMLQILPCTHECMHIYIYIHMYELYINRHIHTYTHIFSSYFALSTVRCPCPFIPCLDNFSMSEICAPVWKIEKCFNGNGDGNGDGVGNEN